VSEVELCVSVVGYERSEDLTAYLVPSTDSEVAVFVVAGWVVAARAVERAVGWGVGSVVASDVSGAGGVVSSVLFVAPVGHAVSVLVAYDASGMMVPVAVVVARVGWAEGGFAGR